MKLIQKSYRKILLAAFFGLVGLSTGVQKSYATLFGHIRKNPFRGYTLPPCYRRAYSRYTFPVSYTRPLGSRKVWSLAGIYPSGQYCPRLTWPYIPYSSFTTQSLQTSPSGLAGKGTRSAVGPQKINFGMAPQPISSFVGRKKEIARLAPYFHKKDKLVVLPPIIGFAGVGKTQLVHQLIAQHATQYAYIVWINAATQKDIQASYLQIAKELAMSPTSYNSTTQLVQDKIGDKNVLYVFNNAENFTMIQPYLTNGHILITSSNNTTAAWASSHYDAPLALEAFSEEEALELVKAMGQDSIAPSLIELIQLLPKYPLVISQLLSDMCEGISTPEALLQEIAQNNDLIKQLSANSEAYTTYQNMLSNIIKNTLEGLQGSKNGAALLELVQQMACLDAQPIPLSFVLLALGQEGAEKQTRDMLSTLAKHGLVIQDADHIHMHGAIQAIIGDLYPLTPQQVKHLVGRYAGYTLTKVASELSPRVCLASALVPHGEKLLAYVQAHGQEDDNVAKCYHMLSHLYFVQGHYQGALACGNKALILFTNIHGKDTPHIDIASVNQKLGDICGKQRAYTKAREYYQKCLDMEGAIYGDTFHENIAFIYNNLGDICRHQRAYDQAIAYYQKALEVYTKLHGDAPQVDMADAYHNLGDIYDSREDYKQAGLFYEKSLEMRQKIYGDMPHPAIASAYHRLAGTYYGQTQYAEARKLYEKALEMKGAIDGDSLDADTATAYHHLGRIYDHQGMPDQAIAYYQKALQVQRKVYGDLPHPTMAASYNNLGSVYNDQGQYDKAVDAFEKGFDIQLQLYGNNAHPDIASSYHNLALTYANQGQYAQAHEFYQKAIDMYSDVYGDLPHQNIAFAYNNLGGFCEKQGQYDQAQSLYGKAIDMQRKIYGDLSHPDIASSYNNLGNVYHNQGQYVQADALYQKALDIYNEVYGDQPQAETANVYQNLGSVCGDQGKYAQARALYQKSLDIYIAIYGDIPHPDIANVHNNLGGIYCHEKQYAEARALYEKALEIKLKIYGNLPHPNIANGYQNLGGICHKEGQYAQAREFYHKALEMNKAVYGDIIHPSIANIYQNLGGGYYAQGQYAEARAFYQKALEMNKAVYGGISHASIANIYHNIGTLSYKEKKYTEAHEAHQKALQIRQKVYGDLPHPHIALSYEQIGYVYCSQWRFIKAFSFFWKASALGIKYREMTNPTEKGTDHK